MLDKIKNKLKRNPKTTKNSVMSNKDYEQLGRKMEQVYVSGYASKGRLIYMTVLRGIAYGVGIFIGGTIVVGIVIATLVQFEDMPIIGPFVQKINYSIEQGSQADIESVRQEVQAQ